MEKQVFNVQVEDGKFWIEKEDVNGNPYQEEACMDMFDRIANGYRWSIHYKQGKQRKWRSGCTTLSIYPMLRLVELNLKDGKQVMCQTPDVEINFYV